MPIKHDIPAPRAAGVPAEPPSVTAAGGFDWVMAGLGGALVVGGVIDGWAHNHDPGVETFFTPWHALLYSALLVNGGVLSLRWLVGLRRGLGRRRALPSGYGVSLVGTHCSALVAPWTWSGTSSSASKPTSPR